MSNPIVKKMAEKVQPKARHLFGAVCARFKLPEQGMTEFDVLSRASAFAIDMDDTITKVNGRRVAAAAEANGSKQQLDLLPTQRLEVARQYGYMPVATSLHVVRPFLFPNYYPEEWLQFIRPENIQVSLEIRNNDTGELENEFPLQPEVYAHPTRDVAIMFVDVFGFVQGSSIDQTALESLDFSADTLDSIDSIAMLQAMDKLQLFTESLANGEDLVIGGHLLNAEPHEDHCRPRPAVVAGKVVGSAKDPDLLLAETEIVLQAGMCGGPVMDTNGRCVGVVEGVVQNVGDGTEGQEKPRDNVDGTLKDGLAAILPTATLEELMVDVLDKRAGERHHPPHATPFDAQPAPPGISALE